MKNKKIKSFILGLVVVVLVGFLLYFLWNYDGIKTKELSYSEFRSYIVNFIEDNEDGNLTLEKRNEQINAINVTGYNVNGYFLDSDGNILYKYSTTAYSLYGNGDVVDEWAEGGVQIVLNDPNAGSVWGDIIYFAVIIGIGLLMIFIMRQSMGTGNKTGSFAKTKVRETEQIKVRFTDVAGAEEEKEELAEIVEFLKSPKKYLDLGARTPKGVLLVGPPGTGKTLFAKAVAGEANVKFFSASGSDFVEMFVGVGASRVRDLFDTARKNAPCIIFIDEIDAVGRQRGAGLGGGHDEREQTLNQILVQMDGFENADGVIVMAATNRADILDPALLRPGRFDRQIYVNLPDVKGREAILKVHSRNKPLAQDVNFKTIARMTSGFSGADLANLLNEAAILAARANKKVIGNLELYEGINKVLMGPQKKSRVVTESDKRCTAYHEAGHAILARLCPNCDPVHEVSIIPRGNAAGYTMTRPDSDDNDVSVNKLTDMICMILGGRVAEELVIHDVTTGASNDLQKVTDLARKMVTQWGMNKRLGLVAYGDDTPVFIGRDYEGKKGYSEQTAAAIDEEVRKIVDEAHKKATELLSTHRDILDNMARTLVEKETIYTEEVELLMEGKSYLEVIAYMDEAEKRAEENPFSRFNK